jgi:16S rRNA (uracil1498-N3)-methyltransferase
LICQRTEKQKFRADRMKSILVSAMLQSQQVWLPVLHAPLSFELLFRQEEIIGSAQKFIAHCENGDKPTLSEAIDRSLLSRLILIGPEGDFSPEEIEQAIQCGFSPVTLGETRLRSETAAVAAAVLLALG